VDSLGLLLRPTVQQYIITLLLLYTVSLLLCGY